MFGQVAVWISVVLSILFTILFFISHFKDGRIRRFTNIFYYTLPITLGITSVYLLVNILNHNYQFTYIWQYSNNSLPLHLLVTSFFSGQEGSFLLWALLVSVFVLFVKKNAREYGYDNLVMAHFNMVMIFLTLMMVLKSPFTYIWESFPNEGLTTDFMPVDGRGLNPILENFWNMIHPPILFVGFAAMTVSFVFAVSALIKKDYQNWIKVATPWILFASGMLGTGIILGGFWSYETLGWGGFWGWDPVENASLLPWIVSVALIHTLLVQKKNGGLVKTNFFLSLLSFILVLFSTFLTRSGVLGDMSVHSFGEPGGLTYAVLLGGLLLFFFYSLIFLLIRFKEINKTIPNNPLISSSREFILSLGALSLLVSTVIIFVGTTWPITTEILGATKASVDISFYDKWNLPIAIVMLLLNGVAYYFAWRGSDMQKVVKRAILPIVISIIITTIVYFLKVDRFDLLLLFFASIFSFIINFEILIKTAKTSLVKTGAALSHIGVALLLIGVIFSGGYAEKETHTLALGEEEEIYDYKVKFIGRELVNPDRTDQERYNYKLQFTKGNNSAVIGSIMYLSDFNDRTEIFLEPGILTTFWSDFYVSPVTFHQNQDYPQFILSKGTSQSIPGDDDIQIKLTAFDMSGGETNEEGALLFGAVFDISNKGQVYTDTLYTWMNTTNFSGEPVWEEVPGTGWEVAFGGLASGVNNMGNTKSVVYYRSAGNESQSITEAYTFQLELKPFMYLVWIGSFFTVLGFFIAILKKW